MSEQALADQYLTFKVVNDSYALPVATVREILEYRILTTIPLVPEYIRGILNLRGNVIPVVDMAVRFGFEKQETTKISCIIIIEIETDDSPIRYGMVVDNVENTIEIKPNNLLKSPSFGTKIRADFIQGMVKEEENFIVLLNLSNVFLLSELTVQESFQSISSECETEV